MSANKRINPILRLLAALGTVSLTVLVSMAAYSLAGRLEVERESDRHSFETAAFENEYPLSPVEVFAAADKNNTLTGIVISFLDTSENEMIFLRVPVNTTFEMSVGLYVELSSDNPRLPKIVNMSGIINYYDGEDKSPAYEALRRICGEFLPKEPDFCTILNPKTFNGLFDIRSTEGFSAGSTLMSYKNRLSTMPLLIDLSANFATNCPEETRLAYLESLDALSESDVLFMECPGISTNSGFVVDKERLAEMIK